MIPRYRLYIVYLGVREEGRHYSLTSVCDGRGVGSGSGYRGYRGGGDRGKYGVHVTCHTFNLNESKKRGIISSELGPFRTKVSVVPASLLLPLFSPLPLPYPPLPSLPL